MKIVRANEMSAPIHQVFDWIEEGNGPALADAFRRDASLANCFDPESNDQPLHVICWQKQVQMLGIIQMYKPDVNARGCYGRTPLHYAVHEGDVISAPIVSALLDWGADPSLRDDAGFTPEAWAKIEMYEGLDSVLKLLRRG